MRQAEYIVPSGHFIFNEIFVAQTSIIFFFFPNVAKLNISAIYKSIISIDEVLRGRSKSKFTIILSFLIVFLGSGFHNPNFLKFLFVSGIVGNRRFTVLNCANEIPSFFLSYNQIIKKKLFSSSHRYTFKDPL